MAKKKATKSKGMSKARERKLLAIVDEVFAEVNKAVGNAWKKAIARHKDEPDAVSAGVVRACLEHAAANVLLTSTEADNLDSEEAAVAVSTIALDTGRWMVDRARASMSILLVLKILDAADGGDAP